MKTVCKKLFSLLLVAVLLVSAVPFQASAAAEQVILEVNIGTSTNYIRKWVSTGTVISTMLPDGITVANEYKTQSSDGKEFQGWKFAGGPMNNQTVNTGATLSADMTYLNSIGEKTVTFVAQFGYPERTIYLNANGGSVSPNSIAIDRDGRYPTLPTPTRDGYLFNGWYTAGTNQRVDTGSLVENYDNLVANWVTGTYNVTFQKWVGESFVDTSSWVFNVTNGKSLNEHVNTNGGSLPQYNDSFGVRSGYSVNGWVDENGNAFTFDTKITRSMKIRPNYVANTYTMTYDYNCPEMSDKTVQVKFDAPVNLEQPTRANYVFQGWIVVLNGQSTGKEIKSGDKNIYGDFTVVAQWAPKGTVELRIYRDDAEGFMVRYYSAAVLGGELDLNNCKIQNYLTGTYDFDGWYDYNGWVSYLGTKSVQGVEAASNSITRIEKVTTSNTANSTVTVIYGMVRNYKAPNNSTGSGSNNTGNSSNTGSSVTTKPADPSNPATGDFSMIEISVATMTLAAAALVVMMQLRKRKMI